MRNKKILFIALVALSVGGYFLYGAKSDAKEVKKDISQKQKSVKTLKLSTINETDGYLIRQGVIKGQKEIYLSPKAEGRVLSLNKDIGQRIKKGQLLAKIDGKEYLSQVNVAKTGYDFAKKSVSKTKDFFASQIKQAKKGRELAKEGYEMAKKSNDSEAISKAKANYELAKKAVKTAESGYELQVKMARGNRDVAMSQLNAASTVASNTNLRAPFSGIISEVMVEVGDLVSPKRPMFFLVDDTKKEIKASVESYYLDSVKVDDEIDVKVNNKIVKGKIKAISPMIDSHSRKGIIKISLPDDKELKIGTYVEVFIKQDKKNSSTILIPQKAIVRLYHDSFVFILDGNKVKKTKIEVGQIIGNNIEVTNGLTGDETLIVEGQHYLNNGESVKVTE